MWHTAHDKPSTSIPRNQKWAKCFPKGMYGALGSIEIKFSNTDSLLSARGCCIHPYTWQHTDTFCNPPSRRWGLSHVYRDAPFAKLRSSLQQPALTSSTVGSVASFWCVARRSIAILPAPFFQKQQYPPFALQVAPPDPLPSHPSIYCSNNHPSSTIPLFHLSTPTLLRWLRLHAITYCLSHPPRFTLHDLPLFHQL